MAVGSAAFQNTAGSEIVCWTMMYIGPSERRWWEFGARKWGPGPVLSSGHTRKGELMATQRAMDEADIRRRIDTLVGAVRAMDLESLKPVYAPDIVSFDIEPPLRHVGAAAKWKN